MAAPWVKIRKCVYCEKEFTPNGDSYRRKQQITCTEQCRSLYERSRVDVLIGEGKALISIFSDFVTCNICGKSLKVAGTHFARVHRLDVGSHLRLSERQIIYGLKQGQRCVPESIRTKQGELNIRTGFGKLGKRFEPGANRFGDSNCPPHIVYADRSEKQAAAQKLAAKASSQAYMQKRLEITCEQCEHPFFATRFRAKTQRFCSKSCARRFKPNSDTSTASPPGSSE